MNKRLFIQKEMEVDIAKRKRFDFDFKPASDVEIQKALGIDEEAPEGYIAGWASTPDMDFARPGS